jgi:hypothetical protein
MGLLSSAIDYGMQALFHHQVGSLSIEWKRWFVLVAGVGMAAFGYSAAYDRIPKEAALVTVRGTVVHVETRQSNDEMLSFHLDSLPRRLNYPYLCPHFERVLGALRPGSTVIVWLSYSGLLARIFGPEIWRIQKGQETIVSYNDLVEARRKEETTWLVFFWIGVGGILLALPGTVWAVKRKLCSQGDTPPP